MIVEQIDLQDNLSEWQHDIRQHFIIQGTAGMNGCISPNLDEFTRNVESRNWLIRLSECAIQAMKLRGQKLVPEYLNCISMVQGSASNRCQWTLPIETKRFVDYGIKWLELLRGNPRLSSEPAYNDIIFDPLDRD